MPQLFGFPSVPVRGERTFPVLGPPKRFFDFLDDPVGVVMRLRQHGDVAAVVDRNPAIVCVYGPERNRQILSDQQRFRHDEDLFRGPEGSVVHQMRNALVCINGDQHRRHRKLMQPAFASRRPRAATCTSSCTWRSPTRRRVARACPGPGRSRRRCGAPA